MDRRPATYADLEALPANVVGELIAGELYASPRPAAPHVVAHDYGGAVALRAHLIHGRHFSSMVLVDVVALAPWGSPAFRLLG